MSFSGSAVTIINNQSQLYSSGPNWNDYINENGSHTLILHAGQINYWNGSSFVPINTTIIDNSNNQLYATGCYDIYWNGSKKLTYKKNETSFTFIRGNITYDDSKKIYTLNAPQEIIPEINGNELMFKDVYQSIDVEYIYNTDLLKQNIILNKLPDLPSGAETNGSYILNGNMEYSDNLEIWANNQKRNGSFVFRGTIEFKSSGESVFSLAPLKIYDSNGEVTYGSYQVIRSLDKIQLNIVIPYMWLSNSSRTFPVIVDPSTTEPSMQDTYIDEYHYNTEYGDSDELHVQSFHDDSIFSIFDEKDKRIFLKYNIPFLEDDYNLISANLYMYCKSTEGNRKIDVYHVNDNRWTESDLNWKNHPTLKSYISYANTGPGWQSWNLRSAVSTHISQTLSLTLKDSSEGSTTRYLQKYYSYEYSKSYGPRIVIIYSLPEPETSICSKPEELANKKTATFVFNSNRISKFKIRLDGIESNWEPSTYKIEHEITFYNLNEGEHLFEVWAKDSYGKEDLTPAKWEWTIDTKSPDTTITSHPNKLVNQRTAKFTFSSSEQNSRFSYSLDSGSWNDNFDGSKTFKYLNDGTHLFQVKAIDAAGNEGDVESFDWVIDATDPITYIDSGPIGIVSDRNASFTFSSNENNVEFSYNFENQGWKDALTNQFSKQNLALGEYTLLVRAKDQAGNIDSSPESRTWTIANPDMSISSFDITFTEVGI